jgi:calcineurin-like phosphoesterase family protein
VVYFTADQHHNHNRIIQYCRRPFATVEQMDATLIHRFGTCVTPEDIVYDLGDFALCGGGSVAHVADRLRGLLEQMPCKQRYLYLGNHDNRRASRRAGWTDVFTGAETVRVMWGTLRMQLCHRLDWPSLNKYDGVVDVILHGHRHRDAFGRVQHVTPRLVTIDVGVDAWNFAPVSAHQLGVLARRELGYAEQVTDGRTGP